MDYSNPNEARVVKITNPFDFDYTHAYGGVPYQLRAGSTQLFPFAIGNHLATHLARQALIRKAPMRDANNMDGRGSDRPLWDDQAIRDLKEKIISDAYVEERPAPVSEAEAFRRKVEELNKDFPSQVLESTPVTTGTTAVAPEGGAKVYQDKAEVIAELTKRGIAHNPRLGKANLEKLLN